MRRLDVVPPVTAVLLGALGLALIVAWVALTYLTGDVQASRDGAAPVFAVLGGLLGMLVARRQPRNPEGWLLLGVAVAVFAVVDSGLYAVLDYHVRHGQLPLRTQLTAAGAGSAGPARPEIGSQAGTGPHGTKE